MSQHTISSLEKLVDWQLSFPGAQDPPQIDLYPTKMKLRIAVEKAITAASSVTRRNISFQALVLEPKYEVPFKFMVQDDIFMVLLINLLTAAAKKSKTRNLSVFLKWIPIPEQEFASEVERSLPNQAHAFF